MSKLKQYFEVAARKISQYAGKPATFACAFLAVIIWAAVGPIFDFSDTWQLVINTSTTIITFLMVFLVQSAQNRDSKALQLKLDELIFKLHQADNVMIDIEELSEEELDELSEKYKKLREHPNSKALEKLQKDTRAADKKDKITANKEKPKPKDKKPKNY